MVPEGMYSSLEVSTYIYIGMSVEWSDMLVSEVLCVNNIAARPGWHRAGHGLPVHVVPQSTTGLQCNIGSQHCTIRLQ